MQKKLVIVTWTCLLHVLNLIYFWTWIS